MSSNTPAQNIVQQIIKFIRSLLQRLILAISSRSPSNEQTLPLHAVAGCPPTPTRHRDSSMARPVRRHSEMKKLQLQLHNGDVSYRPSRVRRKTRLTCEEDGQSHSKFEEDYCKVAHSKTTLMTQPSLRSKTTLPLTITVPPPSLSLGTAMVPISTILSEKISPTPVEKESYSSMLTTTSTLITSTSATSLSPTLYSPSPIACSFIPPLSADPTAAKRSLSVVPEQSSDGDIPLLQRTSTEPSQPRSARSFGRRHEGLVRTGSQRLRTLSANLHFPALLERSTSQPFSAGVGLRRVSSFMSRSGSNRSPTSPNLSSFWPADGTDPFAMNGESYTNPSAISDVATNVYDLSAFMARGYSPMTRERKSPRSIRSTKTRGKRTKAKTNVYDLTVHAAGGLLSQDRRVARRERTKEMSTRRKARVVAEKRRSKRCSNASNLSTGILCSTLPPGSAHASERSLPRDVYTKSSIADGQQDDESRKAFVPPSQRHSQLALDVRGLHYRETSGVLATSLIPSRQQRPSKSNRISLLVPSDIHSLVDENYAVDRSSYPASCRSSEADGTNGSQRLNRLSTGPCLGPITLPSPAFTAQSNLLSIMATSTTSNTRPVSYPPSRYPSEFGSNAGEGNLYQDFRERIKLHARSPAPALTPRSASRPQYRRATSFTDLPDAKAPLADLTMPSLLSPSEFSETSDETSVIMEERVQLENEVAPKARLGLCLDLQGEALSFGIGHFSELSSEPETWNTTESDISLKSIEIVGAQYGGKAGQVLDERKDRVMIFEKGVWPKLIGGY